VSSGEAFHPDGGSVGKIHCKISVTPVRPAIADDAAGLIPAEKCPPPHQMATLNNE
jgi:hypothetical protein